MGDLPSITVNNKGVMRAIKTPRYRGIVLHDFEKTIIQHVHIHKAMRATSIHTLYSYLSPKKLSAVNISHRLTKMIDSGILVRLNEKFSDVGGKFVKYYYKIGDRGFDALVVMGVITKEEAKKQLQSNRNLKSPSFHTKAASVICNNIAVECLKVPDISNVKMSRGNTHSEFGTTADISNEMKGLIIPDYVFEGKDTYVTIEIDTGHQRGNVIQSKYERYKKKAASLLGVGKKLIVVFVVIDDSVSNETLGERDKRVNSLKGFFPPFIEWGDNLYFYAIRAVNSPALVIKLLTEAEPIEQMTREFIVDDWIDSVQLVEQQRLSVTRFNIEDFSTGAEHMNAAGFVRFAETGRYPKAYGLLFMQEGSVRDYQLFQTNILRAEQYNDSIIKVDNIPSYTLMLLYESTNGVNNDVIAFTLPETVSVFLTDISTWSDKQFNVSDTSILPKIWELVSPYKKVIKEGYRL